MNEIQQCEACVTAEETNLAEQSQGLNYVNLGKTKDCSASLLHIGK
jgi:hypothetical protein